MDSCLNNTFQSIDDLSYFYNNLTASISLKPDKLKRPLTDSELRFLTGPVFNFTGLLAANFSLGLVNCYQFTNQTYVYAVQRYALFDKNVTKLVNSFVFGIMANILTIKNIFIAINKDIDIQNYYDITRQYGRLIRVLFLDFDVV